MATLTVQQAEARLTFLQGQLTAIATSMRQALARKDGQTLETLRTMYKKLAAEAAKLRTQINESEMPGTFLVQLGTFSDAVVSVGKQLGVAATSAVSGLGSALKALPYIVGGVAVIGLVYLLLRARAGR